jgi:hypothetical protein
MVGKMSVKKLVFLGKSKKKTGNTKFIFKGFKRRVKKAIFINIPRYKKVLFWTDYRRVIHKKIVNNNPDLVRIYFKDIPYEVLQKISPIYTSAIFYPDIKAARKKYFRSAIWHIRRIVN